MLAAPAKETLPEVEDKRHLLDVAEVAGDVEQKYGKTSKGDTATRDTERGDTCSMAVAGANARDNETIAEPSHRRDQHDWSKEGTEGVHEGDKQSRGLGRLELFNLWIMLFFMGCQLSLPYILSVYLVRDFYGPENTSEQLIAQLTGLLAAAQSFSRALCAYPWGLISDVVGRKVCTLIGTVAATVSMLGFGFSGSFLTAMLTRAVPALLLGSPVALKSMVGDSCDQVGQANAMAVFNLGHGLGTIVGPVMGGALAYPCSKSDRLPFCGENGILRKRPFLLPCMAVSLIGVLATLSTTIFMKETHPRIVNAPGGWIGNLLRIFRTRSVRQSSVYDEERHSLLLGKSSSTEQSTDVEMGRLHSRIPAGRMSEDEQDSLEGSGKPGHDLQLPQSQRQLSTSSASSQNKPEGNNYNHQKDIIPARMASGEHDALLADALDSKNSSSGKGSVTYRWWKDKNVRVGLVGSGLCAFLFNFQDELAPIFVSADVKNGGLSMPLEDFTWPISFGGLVLVIFSLGLYPRLVKRLGSVAMCRAGLLMGIPATIILPLASLFTKTYILEQGFVFLSSAFHSIAKIAALNSSMIVVNLIAPKAAMGAVNGGAMTLQSAGRALGPILSGSVWAGVVSLHVSGQQFVAFALISVSFALTQFLYILLHLPSERM